MEDYTFLSKFEVHIMYNILDKIKCKFFEDLFTKLIFCYKCL